MDLATKTTTAVKCCGKKVQDLIEENIKVDKKLQDYCSPLHVTLFKCDILL